MGLPSQLLPLPPHGLDVNKNEEAGGHVCDGVVSLKIILLVLLLLLHQDQADEVMPLL